MANINVCDRCGKELHKEAYKTGLSMRPPRFYGFMPMKSGANDMWRLEKARMDFCQDCTAEFLVFAERKKRGHR